VSNNNSVPYDVLHHVNGGSDDVALTEMIRQEPLSSSVPASNFNPLVV